MKKFFLKSALFLLVLASLTSVVVFIFEKGLGTITNSYNLKRQQLESQADSIEVLVLGTSQSLHGINPSYFSLKGYNAGNSAQTIFYDVGITLKYLNKMRKLKYVLIAISDYSMGFELYETDEKWRDYFYAQCWGIKYPEIKSTDMYLYSKILLYTPEVSLGYAVKCFHVNLTEDYYPNGWARLTTTTEINDHNAYILAHKNFYHSNCYENIKGNLDTLLYELKKRNITPVFFTPPITSCYFKFVPKEHLDTMYSTVSGFCDKYKCRYLDYVSDKRFQNSDFADCNHLNSSGAEKFSKILNADILEQGTLSTLKK
ncbi:MAG TPA: D-alanyl-lipoteichoic acid biosynthesis protein DltD [Bacteroidia bacterium]|nr:D-alanyl-lipoteichoic acid biosynthesis protein DltD [Bacteroidia bacterium]